MRLVAIQRHGQWLIGTLDSDGEFLQDRRFAPLPAGPRKRLLGLLVPTINSPTKPGEHVYEFRDEEAGSLIKGQINRQGRFIPEVGSKVEKFEHYCDIHSYRPGKSLRIYNLPGEMYLNETEHDKRYEEVTSASPVYSEEKENYDLPNARSFAFEPQTKLRVEIRRGEIRYRGVLDAGGNFVRDTRFIPSGEEFPSKPGGGLQLEQIVHGEPRFVPPMNTPEGAFDEEHVYELREDVLVPGKLGKDGRFIPEVGRKVIKFERNIKDRYAYRIYNLPGQFVHLKAENGGKKD